MKKEKYQILISAITDKRLRLQDLGLLATMLTMKEGWKFSVRGMTAILPAGKTQTANTINRLIKNGYILREQSNQKGCYGRCNYQFFSPIVSKKIKINKKYRPKLDADRFGLLSECIRDTTMTLEERGLYLKLLSMPDDWQHSVVGLSTLTSDSRTKITNTLKKLIDRGLIKNIEVRKNGKFAYHIFEIIKLFSTRFKNLIKAGKLRKKGKYYEEITLTNNPDTVKPDEIKKEKNICVFHNNLSYAQIEKIICNRIKYDSLVNNKNEFIITTIKDSITEILCLDDCGRTKTSSGIKSNRAIKAKTLFSIHETEVEHIYNQIIKAKSKIKSIKAYIKQAIINLVDSFYLPTFEYNN